jgi:CHAT domain-containing protein/tetratricopeptide (TPR) repeat protein
LSGKEKIQRADELYRADRLLQAEALYRQVLQSLRGDREDDADRCYCFQRLLAIYVRVGRQDQAIQAGLEYEGWLRRIGDLARARELNLDLGRWYVGLGHYATAESRLRLALADIKGTSLPPARKVTALTYLALAKEKQGDREQAAGAWHEVETFACAWLDAPRSDLDPALRIECVRSLADSYRFQGRSEEAVGRLEQVLSAFDELKKPDPTGQRDTVRQLAGHLTVGARLADAQKRLQEALDLHQKHSAGDRLTHADLACELADVLERQGRTQEADTLRQQAIRDYQAVLKDPQVGRPEMAGSLAAFWKLQLLYQRTSQYDRALKLTQDQAEQWAGSLIESRLHGEQGRLQVLLGDYGPSQKLLTSVVSDLQRQSPPNLIELPAALLNLAVAELATGGQGRAEEVGRRCLDLYHKHRLADDLVLVLTYNLLGTCAAQDGDYARAIDHFRAGVALCDKLGPASNPPHCTLLLNIALLHKAQGDLDQSLAFCQKAREVYQRFATPQSLGLAAFDAATAAQLAARTRLEEANALAKGILDRCQQQRNSSVPLVITARHCQALFHLKCGAFSDAEAAWREVEQLHGPQSPLRPRTLFYLGLTRELQGRLDEAEKLYQDARRLQRQDPRAFPVTQHNTLWRLANVTDRLGRRADAHALLEEAVNVVEKARLRTYGDAQQRATFFAQFAPAFEQMVAWSVRDGDVPAAVLAVARGRSRTLLDQLLLANVDPRLGLQGPKGEQVRQEEAQLRQRIAALRAKTLLLSPEASKTEPALQISRELDTAQERYTEVYRDILNASPVYHSLAGQQFTAEELDGLRDRAIGPKKLLLVYHIGRQQSHLLLLGGRSGPAEAFALRVPRDVAERVAPANLMASRGREPPEKVSRGPGPPEPLPRGITLQGDRQQVEAPPVRGPGPTVPLGQAVLRFLVEDYLAQITSPKFRPEDELTERRRGDAPKTRVRAGPLSVPDDLLGEVLLPAEARQRIRSLAPECLILIPDGALHKLPFEALLLRVGDRLSYGLDELPPLVYAPSVAILALLANRLPAAPARPEAWSLLTVANPTYPQRADVRGQFPPLTHAAKESERIRLFFDPRQVKALSGTQATEKALVAALPGRQVVHIAAHGTANNRFGNQFGALVLTPPPEGQETPEDDDDGFLTLHEIYRLPLEQCELAVLSACVTNVGPQLPLEAGVTLAGGFLSAGARRVVASHWGVDDESTAELMAAFFQEMRAAARAGRPLAAAYALQQARQQVRDQAKWSAPYYWAPFVLVGPSS